VFQFDPLDTYGGIRRLVIWRAADGDNHALDYLLRGFIEVVKKGRAPDPEVAHVVGHVLERVLAGESVGKILGTQTKRGRPRTYKKAILIHAMVQHSMLLRILRPGQTQRRSDDAKAAVAETLGMNLETVRDNYRRASNRIKTIRDKFPYINLERSGFSVTEALYVVLYILIGAKIRADRGKRHFSSTDLAKYKNSLETILDLMRLPNLPQVPGWLWQFLQFVYEHNFWLLEDCVESPVAKTQWGWVSNAREFVTLAAVERLLDNDCLSQLEATIGTPHPRRGVPDARGAAAELDVERPITKAE
jgi:hypothetical protein